MNQANKTVRVFISSTFRDMHAERDHLVVLKETRGGSMSAAEENGEYF